MHDLKSFCCFGGSRQLHFHIILWQQSHISLGWGSVAVKKSCKYVDFPHRIARLITSIQPCCAGRSYTVEEAGCRLTWTPAWRGSAWSPAFPGSQHTHTHRRHSSQKPTAANWRADWSERLDSLLAPSTSSFSWVRRSWQDSRSGWSTSERHPGKDNETATRNSALHRCLDTKGKLVFVVYASGGY